MPIMNQMRNSMKYVLYTLLGAFLLLIVLEWGGSFSSRRQGGSPNVAGTIDGKVISAAEYERTYKSYLDNKKQQTQGAEIDEQTDLQLRQQAWDALVTQTLLQGEIKRLGLTVTDEEIVESVFSDNPPQVIAQQFRDPQTGIIDKVKLQQAIVEVKNRPVWVQIEDMIRQEKLYEKLQSVMGATVHATDEEARARFEKQNMKLAANFVLFELARAKADSLYPVSESDIKGYYREHRDEYKQDPVRSAKFVLLNNTPTSRDTALVRDDIKKLIPEFESAKNDTEFVAANSEKPADFNKTYERGALSKEREDVFFSENTKAGSVYGPFFEGGEFQLVKILEVKEGDKETVRASHILLQPTGNTKADTAKVMDEAKALMKTLKTDADFEKAAKEKSKDPGSGAQGGDLGWFGKGRMVKEFEEASFKAKVGETVGPVRSQFGIHIIKVKAKETRALKGVEVSVKVKPSPRTIDSLRTIATDFQFYASQLGFDSAAALKKLPVRETGAFQRSGFIPVIGVSRNVSDFAFRARLKDVSDVVEVKDGFSVLQLIDENEDGFRRLDENLTRDIKAKLIRKKKLDELRERATELSAKVGTDSTALEKLRSMDSLLVIKATGQVALANGFIPGLGRENGFIGALTGLELNKLSKPIETNRGIAVAVLTEKTGGAAEEFEKQKQTLRDQILQEKKTEVVQNWMTALKKAAKIEDTRNL